jgi:hypothetical protein
LPLRIKECLVVLGPRADAGMLHVTFTQVLETQMCSE